MKPDQGIESYRIDHGVEDAWEAMTKNTGRGCLSEASAPPLRTSRGFGDRAWTASENGSATLTAQCIVRTPGGVGTHRCTPFVCSKTHNGGGPPAQTSTPGALAPPSCQADMAHPVASSCCEVRRTQPMLRCWRLPHADTHTKPPLHEPLPPSTDDSSVTRVVTVTCHRLARREVRRCCCP